MHNASSDSKVLLKSNSTTAYCLHLKQNLMMKKFTLAYVGALFFVVISFSCQEKQSQTQQPTQDKIAKDSATEDLIFERGTPTSKDKFVGDVYMNLLVEEDSLYTTKSGSVTFEAGARTNWHYHPSGQILMVTNGVGYHQIEGKPKEEIKKGDVIKVPANKKHWHGASVEKAMTHIFVIPNVEKGGSKWFDEVTEEEFKN